jgi:signal transduction histidine kinase
VFAAAASELAVAGPRGAPLTAVAVAVPLLWRRRRPVAVAAAVLAAIGLQSTLLDLDSFPLGDILAMVVATYAIGAYAERRSALAGLGLIAVGAGIHAAAFYPDGVVPALLGGVALPWTIGRIVRGNRDLTREERQKSREIERSHAREARAAVTSERMRVARELHDAVAHNISVIAIQAGGADGIVERDPARAEQCVELIETVAREALAELGRLIRPHADDDDAGEPSLARVDQLADRARAAGVPVELSVEGRPAPLQAGLDLAAFRIVQEALANAAKHARANHAQVTVRYSQGAIELEISDDGRGSSGERTAHDGGGHGLVGMRERVALYGGSLDAGPRPAGGYRVHARLPLEGA